MFWCLRAAELAGAVVERRHAEIERETGLAPEPRDGADLAGQFGGAALSRPRRSVAVVDADAQATASEWSAAGELPAVVYAMPLERAARRWIDTVLGIDAGVLVIDRPPHLSAVAEAVVGVADLVVVPCGASAADISATAKTLDLVRRAREVRGGPPAALLVPSRIDRRTSAGRAIEAALGEFGEPIGPVIGQRAAHADALGAGEWIGTYAPRSPALAEVVDDGWGWIFTAVEHWNAECVGWHVCKRGDRFAALQPISMGLAGLYGSTAAGAARGLALRMDHGSQYLSDHFTNQIKFWGIQPSYAFVAEPQTNGVAERFNRTLKEQIKAMAEANILTPAARPRSRPPNR